MGFWCVNTPEKNMFQISLSEWVCDDEPNTQNNNNNSNSNHNEKKN